MTKFDDHLWSHLVTEHRADEISARRTGESVRSRRPLILTGTAGLAAAAVALIVALSASGAPPAFAVTRHHDGWVSVRINRQSGIAGANRKLAAMGIHARVRIPTESFPADCAVIPGARVNLKAMRADAARDAAEGNASSAAALREGARQIANGTEPDVVYDCTFSGSENTQ